MRARALAELGSLVALLLSGCWYAPGQIACETDANCPSGLVCDESLTHAATGYYACTLSAVYQANPLAPCLNGVPMDHRAAWFPLQPEDGGNATDRRLLFNAIDWIKSGP